MRYSHNVQLLGRRGVHIEYVYIWQAPVIHPYLAFIRRPGNTVTSISRCKWNQFGHSAHRYVCELKPSVTVHLVRHPGSGTVYRERTKHSAAAVTAKSLNNLVRGCVGN